MPSRPDLRDISSNVRDAFADADKETLLDVLTFVVKEYVVEGPPPMMLHQAETLSDLKNLSFAQLIAALQTRFDYPELAMFVVDGESVGVRIGGVVQPLLPGRTPPANAPAPAAPNAADQLRAAGVRVIETNLQQAPRPQQQPAQPREAPPPSREAPPPTRGLSVRGASAQTPSSASPPAQPPAAQQGQPAAQPQPASPEAKPEKPEGSGDDASARFSLLELD